MAGQKETAVEENNQSPASTEMPTGVPSEQPSAENSAQPGQGQGMPADQNTPGDQGTPAMPGQKDTSTAGTV